MLDIRAAIRMVIDRYPAALYVSTCGFITRDLYGIADRPQNFYLLGSMGMAGPIGLGIAVANPQRMVVVFDGDASFAMNLGCLPMIGRFGVNIIHVVLDNQIHESTGGQLAMCPDDPSKVALACGYTTGSTIDTEEQFTRLEITGGPNLVHILCRPRDYPVGHRVKSTPQELVTRFQAALREPHITSGDISEHPREKTR